MHGPGHRETYVRMTRRKWHVVVAKQHQEALVQATLAEKGLATYLPRMRQWPPPPVGSAVVPLFPGYVFAHLAMPEDFYSVRWAVGVRQLLSFGDQPALVPDEVIAYLRSNEDEHGLIRPPSAQRRPVTVRIAQGTFRGFEAVVERRLSAKERVVVLIDFLQRQTRVELPETWLRQA